MAVLDPWATACLMDYTFKVFCLHSFVVYINVLSFSLSKLSLFHLHLPTSTNQSSSSTACFHPAGSISNISPWLAWHTYPQRSLRRTSWWPMSFTMSFLLCFPRTVLLEVSIRADGHPRVWCSKLALSPRGWQTVYGRQRKTVKRIQKRFVISVLFLFRLESISVFNSHFGFCSAAQIFSFT